MKNQGFYDVTFRMKRPESGMAWAAIAGKLIPELEKVKAAMVKVGLEFEMTEREYTPRLRGGAAGAVNFAVESVIAPPPDEADMPPAPDPA